MKENKFLALLLLIWSTGVVSDIYTSKSCGEYGVRHHNSHCYDDRIKVVPVFKKSLPEGQYVIETFRCGGRLLQAEISRNEALKLCPTSKLQRDIDNYTERFELSHRDYNGYYHTSYETYDMEKWTFKQHGRFRTNLIFRDDILYQIIQDHAHRD